MCEPDRCVMDPSVTNDSLGATSGGHQTEGDSGEGLRMSWMRAGARMLLALVTAGSLMPAQPVLADCPGGNPGYSYASGGQSIQGSANWANGIEGWIGYVNPSPCRNNLGNAFSAEYVNLSRTSTNDGWVQVGWTKRQGWSAPRVYCEFTGTAGTGFWHLHDGTSLDFSDCS